MVRSGILELLPGGEKRAILAMEFSGMAEISDAPVRGIAISGNPAWQNRLPAETAAASKGLNFSIAVLLFYDQLFDKISLEDISRHSLCSPCPSEKMMLLRFVLWRLISRAWLLI